MLLLMQGSFGAHVVPRDMQCPSARAAWSLKLVISGPATGPVDLPMLPCAQRAFPAFAPLVANLPCGFSLSCLCTAGAAPYNEPYLDVFEYLDLEYHPDGLYGSIPSCWAARRASPWACSRGECGV